MHEKGRPLLEEALTIRRGAAAGDTAQMAQTLNDLGVVQRERRGPAGATPLLDDALAMRRRVLGNEDEYEALAQPAKAAQYR